MLEINTWSQIKPPSFKHWVLDTGKEINAWAFIQGNTVQLHGRVMYVYLLSCIHTRPLTLLLLIGFAHILPRASLNCMYVSPI